MTIAISSPNLELTPSLINPSSHDHHGHVVQLYTDDNFLIDVLTRFVGGAIAAGDVAVIIATKSHRAELEKTLSAHGLDWVKAAKQRRYITLDATEILAGLMVDGSLNEHRFNEIVDSVLTEARSGGHKKECHLAVFGELVALLWAEGKTQEAIRLEELWNAVAKRHSFSLLCAYPINGFNNEKHTELFLRICREHTGVLPSESYLGLSNEVERLRNVAHLQQKAQVFEKESAVRETEARFRLLVEAVQDYAIFMLDPLGNVSSWNLGAERIKGYKAEEIMGKHFSHFYPEEDVLNGKPHWELVIAAKHGRFEDEGWRIRKDGSRFWANVIITAVRDNAGKLTGFAKVTRDFTERMQTQKALQAEVAQRRAAQSQLQHSETSLRQLSFHLLRTQDEERRRIGRDLHDSLGQYLSVLKMKLESASSLVGENKLDDVTQELARCIRLTEDSIKEVRTASYLLYPPMLDEMGLRSAIPWCLDGFSARSGIKATFEVHADFGRLPRDIELALFRVLQEGLTNVHRHSGSQIVQVRLSMKEGIANLTIEDKGKGISPRLLDEFSRDSMNAMGIGLRGMKERMRQLGGRLEVTSNEAGTTVTALIPASESNEPGEST